MTLEDLFNHPIINLDKQVRYSNLKVLFPENVAEHSELVANIGIILAKELMLEYPKIKIDIKDIAYRAVIHDWGESVTCDITSDVKYSLPELPKILDSIETEGLQKLFNSNKFIKEISLAREGCIEGDIIMLSDRLQAFFKMLKEYMYQRTKYWKNAIINNSIPATCTAINNLKKYYRIEPKLIKNLISGLEKVEKILNEKIDFI